MGSLNGKPKLYHGTKHFFKDIDLAYSQPYKDFGRGFYLTSIKKQALKWGQKHSASRYYVYEFSIDIPENANLKILPLTSYDLAWIDYVALNRTTDPLPDDFDIVFDKMADNRGKEISPIIHAYRKSEIQADEAIDKLKWPHGDADQYCFKTPAALQHLKLVKCISFPGGQVIIPESTTPETKT